MNSDGIKYRVCLVDADDRGRGRGAKGLFWSCDLKHHRHGILWHFKTYFRKRCKPKMNWPPGHHLFKATSADNSATRVSSQRNLRSCNRTYSCMRCSSSVSGVSFWLEWSNIHVTLHLVPYRQTVGSSNTLEACSYNLAPCYRSEEAGWFKSVLLWRVM